MERSHQLPPDDVATLCAAGATVAILASLAHEVLGHGLACLSEGGSITLLTFLQFRCLGAGPLTDGAGPVGALLAGLLCLGWLALGRPRSALVRVFLLTFGVLVLLWVCGQMMREAIDHGDDWGHVARELHWPPVWRPVVFGAGLAGYAAVVRGAARLGRGVAPGRPARLLTPWLAAVAAAVVLGLLWHGDRAGSALDGLLSFGVAPVGYLPAMRASARDLRGDAPPIRRDWLWIGGAGVLFVVFALTIARGVGPLARGRGI